MPSPFETPDSKRHPGMFATPASAIQSGAAQRNLYPDLGQLPTELQMNPQPAAYNAAYNSAVYHTPEHYRAPPPASSPAPAPTNAVVPVRPQGSTDNLGPVQRAAKTINETLDAEKRYPMLDDIVSRRMPSLSQLRPC